MAEFYYKAKDKAGNPKTGVIKAASKAAAKQRLVAQKLTAISVTTDKPAADGDNVEVKQILGKFLIQDSQGNLMLGEGSPSTKDIVVFTKQFSTMLNSGVPLIQAVGILSGQQRVLGFRRILAQVRKDVENGQTLSDALAAHPDVFDNLFVAMVRAGEASGNLDTILMKLVTYIEKAAKIKSQVKSAMMYPMIVFFVAVGVVSALLVFVVPAFAKQFMDSGKPLPGLTQFVVDLSNGFASNIAYIIAAAIAGFFAFKAWVKTPAGRARFDAILLKSPAIGDLLRKVAVGRFCSTMSTMLTSGVNLLDALTICAASSGNKVIENFISGLRKQIEQGSRLSTPLAEGGIFPPMVVSMVAVGEATGALDDMLLKVSEFYEDEVDLAIKTVLSLIEPVMIVGIGGIVGFIVIAMYMPVFDMASNMG